MIKPEMKSVKDKDHSLFFFAQCKYCGFCRYRDPHTGKQHKEAVWAKLDQIRRGDDLLTVQPITQSGIRRQRAKAKTNG